MRCLLQIVHKTISYHDKDGSGKITYDEFCDVSLSLRKYDINLVQVVEHTDVHKKMVLRKI